MRQRCYQGIDRERFVYPQKVPPLNRGLSLIIDNRNSLSG
jgi:hypothetical protein